MISMSYGSFLVKDDCLFLLRIQLHAHLKPFFSEGFRNLSSKNIWDHLETFFNLEKADLIEDSFLDSDDADVEFSLPAKDFAEAIADMKKGI
jgi:hypothetical protein